mmetsp:Transcript_10044/g.26008  ORF Transcript_10044/g.26008 Transcript_10044/m.26008 type:complete len:188 (+) Transcript_10044:437-1000(+)
MRASVRPQEVKDASGNLIENTEVICCSYYEENKEKPFHMMSNIVEGVEVIDLTKRCYSTSTQKYFDVVIKRLSLANEYNLLQFQVAVITCWCTTPKIILEPTKATAVVPFASPRASTSAPAQTSAPNTTAPATTVATPASNAATPAADEPAKPSMITEQRVEAAKQSYAMSPVVRSSTMLIYCIEAA